MRDTGLAIRTAYFTAFGGENGFAVGDLTVKSYDGGRTGIEPPYILLSTQTSQQGPGARNCTQTDDTILIDIVTRFNGNSGGKRQADLIADQVFQLVYPKLSLSGELQDLATILESSNTLEEMDGATKIYRRLLRFRHNIFQ